MEIFATYFVTQEELIFFNISCFRDRHSRLFHSRRVAQESFDEFEIKSLNF